MEVLSSYFLIILHFVDKSWYFGREYSANNKGLYVLHHS